MTHDSTAAAAASALSIHPDAAEHDAEAEILFDRAFGPGRFAKTAERLREGNHCLRSLSRLAFLDGRLVAAVKLWPLLVGGAPDVVFVGPVAVDKAHRGAELGLKLTDLCLEAAAAEGWKAALLVGDAPYFGRVGFNRVSVDEFVLPGYVAPHRLLARQLAPGALAGYGGAVSVPPDARP